MKKRSPPKRRNPVAKALRRLKPKVVPSAKAYRRRPKHKGHSENPSEWPLDFFLSPSRRCRSMPLIFVSLSRLLFCARIPRNGYSAASLRFWIMSMISAAAVGMWVPGP